MNKKLLEFNVSQRASQMPQLRSGDVVKVYRRIVEGGKERTQLFEGMIIAVRGGQSSSPTITVRKVSNGVGVELVLPVYSPSIEKIEIVKHAKIRRSKLYFVRERSAKSLRFKFSAVSGREKEESVVEEVPEESKEAVQEEVEKASEVGPEAEAKA